MVVLKVTIKVDEGTSTFGILGSFMVQGWIQDGGKHIDGVINPLRIGW